MHSPKNITTSGWCSWTADWKALCICHSLKITKLLLWFQFTRKTYMKDKITTFFKIPVKNSQQNLLCIHSLCRKIWLVQHSHAKLQSCTAVQQLIKNSYIKTRASLMGNTLLIWVKSSFLYLKNIESAIAVLYFFNATWRCNMKVVLLAFVTENNQNHKTEKKFSS